jgi:protein TonB
MDLVNYSFKGNGSVFSVKWVDTDKFNRPDSNDKTRRFLSAIFGEEKPSDMLVLCSLLVALLHVWAVMQLLQENEMPDVQAKPLMMEVSMMSIAQPKSSLEPPPAAPVPEVKNIVEPKKPKPKKPLVKKKPVQVQQPVPDFALTEVVEEQVAQESEPASSIPNKQASDADAANLPFTQASFKANYGHNPKPKYPAEARENGWEGKVKLRVDVTEEGLSAAVAVHRSSGHEILDDAAVTAVKKWRFIPAKRGDKAVASSVIVPLIFSLNDY